jgi:hypothetical protein
MIRILAVLLIALLAGCAYAPPAPKPYSCDIRTNDYGHGKSGCVSRDDWERNWRPVLAPD